MTLVDNEVLNRAETDGLGAIERLTRTAALRLSRRQVVTTAVLGASAAWALQILGFEPPLAFADGNCTWCCSGTCLNYCTQCQSSCCSPAGYCSGSQCCNSCNDCGCCGCSCWFQICIEACDWGSPQGGHYHMHCCQAPC